MLFFKAPLRYGLLCLEPPLLCGAPDWLLRAQLAPAAREELGTLAKAQQWRRRLGVDDDVHLVRLSLLRLRLLQHVALAGGSLGGTLDDAYVRQAASHGPCSLRFLDITGSTALSDSAIAALLQLCPRLRVLHAGGSSFGSASLAALAGRPPQAPEADAEVAQRRLTHHHHRQRHPSSPDAEAAIRLADLHLGSRAAPGPPPVADAGTAEAQPACPLLEQLDLSDCAIKGSALRRALRCMPHLADVRLSGCSALHAVLEPLLLPPSSGGGGSKRGSSHLSSKGARAGQLLAQLTRLEALDADDLSRQHVAALLRHCSGLQHLGLSGKQLAAQQFDRQQHGDSGGDNGSSESGAGCPLPSLHHLEIGWGSGGTCLLHLARQHPQLVSLVAHSGAAVSDHHLAALAASCAGLARLCLCGSNVSDAGKSCWCCLAALLHFYGCPLSASGLPPTTLQVWRRCWSSAHS